MSDYITLECESCGFGMSAPDTPMGRAVAKEFRKEHEGHTAQEQEADRG